MLRNLKLRMSRKLLYAAGMLACFSLALDTERQRELKDVDREGIGRRVEHFRELLARPPLEILAGCLAGLDHLDDTAKKLFTAYNQFLSVLSD